MNQVAFEHAAERDGFRVARAEMTPGRTTPEYDHAAKLRS